jgi:Flp pilus assembly protein TadG
MKPRSIAEDGRAGSIAIEMAILLPLVLAVMLGLMEFGRAIWTQATLDYAVEAAARCGAINTVLCASSSDTQSYAASRAVGLTLNPAIFTVTPAACGMQVSATLPFALVAPSLLPFSITLTSSACYPTSP